MTTIETKAQLDAENAKLLKLTRKTIRTGTPENFAAMMAQEKIARAAWRAHWELVDSLKATATKGQS